MMKQSLKHYWLPLLAVLIWAGNVAVSKMAVGTIEPAAIAFYRWLFAALCMTPFVWRDLVAGRALIRRHWPKFALLGLLGMVIFQCLGYIAAQTTSASNMGLVQGVLPLLTVALSVWWLGERVTSGDLAGGAVSLIGLVYLLSQGQPAQLLQHGVAPGDGYMLVACLAYAAYCVLLKRWQTGLARWAGLCVQIWCAVLVLLVYYLALGRPPVTRAGLPLVLYAGIAGSLLAPMLWMAGVHRLGPQRAAALMNLLPVFAVAIAWAFLGEVLHGYHLLGGALVLAGVVLAQKWTQPLRGALGLAIAPPTGR